MITRRSRTLGYLIMATKKSLSSRRATAFDDDHARPPRLGAATGKFLRCDAGASSTDELKLVGPARRRPARSTICLSSHLRHSGEAGAR